jgi:hypothetical protein
MSELREGQTVRIRKEGSPFHLREGIVYRLLGKTVLVFFVENDGDIETFDISEVRVPLHSGVFVEGEDPEEIIAAFRLAKAQLVAILASGAFERIDEMTGSIPDNVLSAIKKVVAVLGSAEALALFKVLLALI